MFAESNLVIPLIFYIKHMHVVFGRIYPWEWDLIQWLNLSKWSSMVTLQKIYFRVHYFCFFLSLRLSCLEVIGFGLMIRDCGKYAVVICCMTIKDRQPSVVKAPHHVVPMATLLNQSENRAKTIVIETKVKAHNPAVAWYSFMSANRIFQELISQLYFSNTPPVHWTHAHTKVMKPMVPCHVVKCSLLLSSLL